MTIRHALFALPLLAACAGQAPEARLPAARFAAALDQADEVAEQVFDRMDGFERRVAREQMAIGFALNSPVAGDPAPGLAAAAGEVLAPAIAALATHAERLDAAATGGRADIEPGGELLDDAAAAGLDRLRLAGITVPDAERQAGLAAIRVLADGPGGDPRRANAAALAAAADPQVRAVTALLRRVIGAPTSDALRARRAALDTAETRLMDTIRRDRSLGPAQRYALARELAEAREGDPILAGTFEAMLAVLATTEASHAAIAAGGGGGEVAALETAVARLSAYGSAPGRQ